MYNIEKLSRSLYTRYYTILCSRLFYDYFPVLKYIRIICSWNLFLLNTKRANNVYRVKRITEKSGFFSLSFFFRVNLYIWKKI